MQENINNSFGDGKNRGTVTTREEIGFLEDPTQWADLPAVYDEHTLRIAGHPVMEDWEHGYMEVLADKACENGGKVLELGYGLGLSAQAIQSHDIESHTVIECNSGVIEKAKQDLAEAVAQKRAYILEGFWQDVTKTLPDASFDGILFDTYPLKAEEIHSNHFWFFQEAYRLLRQGGTLTYYSDEAQEFSKEHLAKLLEAGFKPEHITSEICEVNPPEDCEYWRDKTILVPIVKKQ